MSKAAAAAIAVAVVIAGAVGIGRTGVVGDTDRAGCDTLAFTHNGTPWKATRIQRNNLSCDEATLVIRAYARPSNCQFLPNCQVAQFRCRTLRTDGSDFTEHCTRGDRSVRWHGSYVSS